MLTSRMQYAETRLKQGEPGNRGFLESSSTVFRPSRRYAVALSNFRGNSTTLRSVTMARLTRVPVAYLSDVMPDNDRSIS